MCLFRSIRNEYPMCDLQDSCKRTTISESLVYHGRPVSSSKKCFVSSHGVSPFSAQHLHAVRVRRMSVREPSH